MIDEADAMNQQYGATDISARILAHLRQVGVNVEALTREDLAAFDEFHGGGQESTRALAELAKLEPRMRVLDLGCGIGGPARTLAAEFGCQLTGIELTYEFYRAAQMLTAKVGLSHLVQFRHGHAAAMRFDDAAFDVVWSQSMAMNIADRDRLYAEIHRVLKPGGRYAFSDVTSGPAGPPRFPVPWARDASISFLLTAETTRRKLEAAGFRVLVFEDVTADALPRAQARMKVSGAPLALGLHIVLGQDGATMLANMARNYEERRVGLIQGIAVRPE